MRILVTGAGGMLGVDVLCTAEALDLEVHGFDHAQLDITDKDSVSNAVARVAPDVIINCAAWTDVDGAEADEGAATLINGAGPENLARALVGTDGFLVHLSSDYVFDGTATEAYWEGSATHPVSAYGRSKLAGEVAIARTLPERQFAIVRTSWLFGVHGGNFVATISRLARERDELTVVDDQVGCPTWTGHLAGALIEIADRRAGGVHHIAGGGECSWFDLADLALERSSIECRLVRGSSEDLKRPAPRPAFSVLGRTRADTPVLPPWQHGVDRYLQAWQEMAVNG